MVTSALDTNPFAEEAAEFATDEHEATSWGIVWIDGEPVPVAGTVEETNLSRFDPPITIGPATKNSDNLIAAWIMADWTGGGQVEDINEGSDNERFRHATADTMHPGLLANPPLTTRVDLAGATGDATPVGDYNGLFWAAFGVALRKYNAGTGSFDGGGTLGAAPAGEGIVYDGLLWIPQGAGGYQTWNGSAVSAGVAGITPVDFEIWDDKLVALEHDGQVSYWDGVTWNSPSELRLRGEYTPRHLINWWTAEREPALYVVTNRDMWVVDYLIPRMYRTGLKFPRHPDHGRGADVWRDDSLYVSVGIGAHQVSLGGVISPAGLDRGIGLPAHLRGVIVDFEPEYNGLLALVQGIFEEDEAAGAVLEETQIYDEALVVSQQSARSTLQRWTGSGWHTVWESAGSEGTPTRVMVSEAAGEYRLWWGYAGSMWTQRLRRSQHNPQVGAQLAIDDFEPSSYLYTGRFDAAMEAYHKLASHLEIFSHEASRGRIEVRYQTDHFDGWKTLGTATVEGKGQHTIEFDPDADGWAEGESFHWIEFLFTLYSADDEEGNPDTDTTPIVEWITFKFVPLPLQTMSWMFKVPINFDEQWMGWGAQELKDFLNDRASTEAFSSFKHLGRTYRGRVAQVRGPDATGLDHKGLRTLIFVEVSPASEAA